MKKFLLLLFYACLTLTAFIFLGVTFSIKIALVCSVILVYCLYKLQNKPFKVVTQFIKYITNLFHHRFLLDKSTHIDTLSIISEMNKTDYSVSGLTLDEEIYIYGYIKFVKKVTMLPFLATVVLLPGGFSAILYSIFGGYFSSSFWSIFFIILFTASTLCLDKFYTYLCKLIVDKKAMELKLFRLEKGGEKN